MEVGLRICDVRHAITELPRQGRGLLVPTSLPSGQTGVTPKRLLFGSSKIMPKVQGNVDLRPRRVTAQVFFFNAEEPMHRSSRRIFEEAASGPLP